MKQFLGMYVVVLATYSRGRPGPVPEWGMPEDVFGCGGQIGWQYTTIPVKGLGFIGESTFGSWIYPTREAARSAAKKHILYLRTLEKKRESRKRKR